MRKIIEAGGAFQNYIKEVDLLDDDFEAEETSPSKNTGEFGLAPPPTKKGHSGAKPETANQPEEEFDLFDLTVTTTPQQPQPGLGLTDLTGGNMGVQTSQPVIGNIAFDNNFGDFQSPQEESPVIPGFTQNEANLVNLGDMGK